MTDTKKLKAHSAAQSKYSKTEKGKIVAKRYNSSEKGKATKRKYNRSKKNKKIQKSSQVTISQLLNF